MFYRSILTLSPPAQEKLIFHLVILAGPAGVPALGFQLLLECAFAFCFCDSECKPGSRVVHSSILILSSVCLQYLVEPLQSSLATVSLASITRVREATSEAFIVDR